MARRTRLGRPPDADSNLTRERICEVARVLFSEQGYEATSNREIADEAGLTTGAIYHYFDRKIDIFTAVYADVQRVVYDRFDKAVAPAMTFRDRLQAILEASHELNNAEPSFANFLGSCRIDARRDPTIAEALSGVDHGRQSDFFADLVEFGVSTGEIDPALAPNVAEVIRTITIGLVDGESGDRGRHRRAIDGVMLLFEGRLVHPPRTDEQ